MAYYNRNCEKLQLKKRKLEYLNEGQCAEVYKYSDIIFKKYFSGTNKRFRLNPETFDILRTINNQHFIELYDIYKEMSLLDLFQYKNNDKLPFVVDAYTAKYYDNDYENKIIYEPVDYLLDNFRELEILFNTFTENEIWAADVKKDNTIINSNGIIIIDPDCFRVTKGYNDGINISNKKKILTLLKSFYLEEITSIDKRYYNRVAFKIDNSLINIQINKNTDITYELSKKLKRVKRPIDYLTK